MSAMSFFHNNQRPQVTEYQQLICGELSRIYPTVSVTPEWASMRDEIGLYSPRLDVAVGPFATTRTFVQEYDSLIDATRNFITELLDCHMQNVRELDNETYHLTFDELKQKNPNARCLLAVEIENWVSRKHMIGSAVNASALGRIGVIIAWTPDKLKAFIKLRRYLEFLGSVGKNTFDTTNLLILNKTQFLQVVQHS